MNFSIEESKENDLNIKAATGNIKTRTIRNLLFSQTLQAVRINDQIALLSLLTKFISIYCIKDLELIDISPTLFDKQETKCYELHMNNNKIVGLKDGEKDDDTLNKKNSFMNLIYHRFQPENRKKRI